MNAAPSLHGKVAVVTGGGSGIGRATALLLASHGAMVHVADLQSDTADEVARTIEAAGGSAVAHALDVSDPDAVEAFAETVFAAEGHVDILHNNAGIGHAGNIEATTIEDWQRVIGVNLLGVAYGIQAFIPRMLQQGRPASVVNTASQAGLLPAAKLAPYCASKIRDRRPQRGAQRRALQARHPRQRDLSRHHRHPDRIDRDHARRRRGDPRADLELLRQARRLAG